MSERAPRRLFGDSGIDLSTVTFGTMRMSLDRGDRAHWIQLLHHLLDRGVDTFHTSHEYDSHELFVECYEEVRQARSTEDHRHIIKLAVPHFEDDNVFDPARFEALVDRERQRLGTECIDVVQWLVRSKPIQDPPRLAVLERYRDEIATTIERLRERGTIGVVTSFPYSPLFADAVLELDVCRGLVTYLNLLELDYVEQLESLAAGGRGFVAIRPLAAARLTPRGLRAADPDGELHNASEALDLTPENVVERAIQFPLMHPAVTSTMVTVNTIQQADQVIEASDVTPDLASFEATVEHVRER